MTDDELNAIEARAQAATPGPWRFERRHDDIEDMGGFVSGEGRQERSVCSFGNSLQYYPTEGSPPDEPDAALITHAREDILALVEEVRRLRMLAWGFSFAPGGPYSGRFTGPEGDE